MLPVLRINVTINKNTEVRIGSKNGILIANFNPVCTSRSGPSHRNVKVMIRFVLEAELDCAYAAEHSNPNPIVVAKTQ